jgi:hypothetical protein
MAFGFAEGAGDVVGFVEGVCVGEEDVFAACCLRAGPAGVVLAGESSVGAEVEFGGVENVDSCVTRGCFGGDVAGVIGGIVVDADQFPLLAEEETWLRLGEDGGQACGMMTESSRSGVSLEFGACAGSVSFTTSYYRKWSDLCVDC